MSSNPRLDAIPEVDIDPTGRFKYILIKVHDEKEDGVFKNIVRGYGRCGFHGKNLIQHVFMISNNLFGSPELS